jgi:class 3 adenylate cyclase
VERDNVGRGVVVAGLGVSLVAVPPSGTMAFLFTDIEGSSARWEADPPGMGAALASRDELLTAVIAAHGGVVFSSMGDGVGAAFTRASDAVAAAVEVQQCLASESGPTGGLRVRMGVHTGEAEERSGNYYGPAVNRAARLMAAAHGGQIVVSEVTARVLPVGTPLDLRDLGTHRLAGISEPLRVFGVVVPGVASIDRPLRSLGVTGNVRAAVNRFVGRDVELTRLADEVDTRPLITLIGTAGVGRLDSPSKWGARFARHTRTAFGSSSWHRSVSRRRWCTPWRRRWACRPRVLDRSKRWSTG